MTDTDKKENKIYKKAIFYGIHTHNSKDMYVGSTTKSLEERLKQHEHKYASYLKDDTQGYISSFEVLKQGDYYIEEIDTQYEKTKQQIFEIEGYYIKLFRCVNQVVAGRKPKEYREDNIEKIREKNAQYREDNREQIRDKRMDYFFKVQSGEHVVKPITEGKIICKCGCEYLKYNEKKHINSKIHEFCLKHGSIPLMELLTRVDLDPSLQGELIKKKRAGQHHG